MYPGVIMKDIDYKERIANLLADHDVSTHVLLQRLNKLLTILVKLELHKAGVDDKDIKEMLDDTKLMAEG